MSIGEVALAVAGMVAAVVALAVPGVAFFAVCGIIGATIALVNSVTNVATSFRAADAAVDGNPAMAVIYGKQDKLSDVLRQTNFGDGTLSFSDLKNSAKNGIVDLKTNIINGYADSKNGSKLDDIGAKGGSQADVLAKNRANGRAFEEAKMPEFSSGVNNAVEQVTIKTKQGTKIRVDAMGTDKNTGNVIINEFTVGGI